jgi:hypothetical protein
MNETFAAGAQDDTRTGKIILIAISGLSAILVIAGLIYATGTGARSQAALTAAGCEPGLSSDTAPCTTQPMLDSEYLAVVAPATRQQSIDVTAYTASEGDNLAEAEAALNAEVASERGFGTSLAGIAFPPAMIPLAQALIQANQARASLLAQQAQSSSLTQLRSFNNRVQAANAAVQKEMSLLLKAIDTPVKP